MKKKAYGTRELSNMLSSPFVLLSGWIALIGTGFLACVLGVQKVVLYPVPAPSPFNYADTVLL
jgi:hypothetical protein